MPVLTPSGPAFGFGASFHCRDGDVVCFPGWRFVHGVTPVKIVEPDGYRISAVYYCVEQMRACGTGAEEMARAQLARTNREADTRPTVDRIPAAIARRDAASKPTVEDDESDEL